MFNRTRGRVIAASSVRPLNCTDDLSAPTARTPMTIQRNAVLQDARLIIVPSTEIAALLALAAADTLTVRPSLETAMHAAREHPTAASDDTPTAAAN